MSAPIYMIYLPITDHKKSAQPLPDKFVKILFLFFIQGYRILFKISWHFIFIDLQLWPLIQLCIVRNLRFYVGQCQIPSMAALATAHGSTSMSLGSVERSWDNIVSSECEVSTWTWRWNGIFNFLWNWLFS